MTDPAQSTPPRRIRYLGRAINGVAVHAPWAWRLIRRPVGNFFGSAADGWDERIEPDSAEHLAPIAAALQHLDAEPARILDVGTGTGSAALMLAGRFPDSQVLGIDIAPGMIDAARTKGASLGDRVRFEVVDVSQLDDSNRFDLIAMLNMPPFFDRLSKLVAVGGYIVNAASIGDRTPFYTNAATLAKGFERYGLETLASGTSGDGSFYVARRPRS